MNTYNIVTKSNTIIEASYSLSISEQRLLFSCLSQINSKENIDLSKPIKLTVQQAQDLFYNGANRYNAYQDLKDACESLYQREIRIKDNEENSLTLTRWVHTAKFYENEQYALLYFTDTLKPYISNLAKNFTEVRLSVICQLTNKYASRIYELILCWCNTQKWQNNKFGTNYLTMKELEILEFRSLLDMNGKYKQIGELKRFVINPCLEQINNNTDMNLEIDFRKIGRSFRYIQLTYSKKLTGKDITYTKGSIHNTDYTKPFSKGLSASQIAKIGVFKDDFINANKHLLKGDGRNYNDIFKSWKPKLKNAEAVNDFIGLREILSRDNQSKMQQQENPKSYKYNGLSEEDAKKYALLVIYEPAFSSLSMTHEQNIEEVAKRLQKPKYVEEYVNYLIKAGCTVTKHAKI